MTYWACSVTIFSPVFPPAVIYDFSYLFHPLKYQDGILNKMKEEHILFATAVSCCIKTEADTYCFITGLYPVYILMKKYIEIYDLDFCTVTYVPDR